ncbi:TPA: hypothetical protein U2C09_001231 [Streptococcus suis]|uniref:hypothetical protein n=1 Tax=Streptococcus dysgalactiae TaxID=1334 RepID=UPI002AAD42D1|nr:hypothetical protein [Streptococcus suis]HEN2802407.1 hypothetical protein [Streptococcus agalactiae]HEP1278200.1 hypothetical protein [Streptococcus pyogenes]
MAFHTNYKIRPKTKFYLLDQVNCVSRAVSLGISSYNKELSDIFLMIDGFEKCYPIKELREVKEPYDREIILAQKYLNLNFKKLYLENNFFETLEENIMQNIPVIIPINLREIFYSDHYKEDDWEHPIIIKGFDSLKRIFYILDYTQLKSDNPQDRDFCIEYDTLYNAYKSYFENIASTSQNFILILEESDTLYREVFYNCVRFILDNLIVSDTEQIDYSKIDLLNIYKYKDLFFSLSLDLLVRLNILSKLEKSDFIRRKNDIIELNRKNFLKICWNIKKGILEPDLVEENKHIKELEIDLIRDLFVRVNNVPCEVKEVEQLYIFENNEDGIIEVDKDNFKFKFTGSKLYNTWLGDDSPKAIFSKSCSGKIYVSLSVRENLYHANFAGGLIIRDGEYTYYYTMDSEKKLNLEKSGVTPSIAHQYIESPYLDFGLEFSNKRCNFLYRTEANSKFRLLYSLKLQEEANEYGIGCKTYYRPEPLMIGINLLTSL